MLFLASIFKDFTLKPTVGTCWLREHYSILCGIWVWVSPWPVTAELLLGSELCPVKVPVISLVEDPMCLYHP